MLFLHVRELILLEDTIMIEQDNNGNAERKTPVLRGLEKLTDEHLDTIQRNAIRRETHYDGIGDEETQKICDRARGRYEQEYDGSNGNPEEALARITKIVYNEQRITLREDGTNMPLFGQVTKRELERIELKLPHVLRTRYGIKAEDTQDILQTAIQRYLTVHTRYGPGENHPGLLMGIAFKVALETIGVNERKERLAKRFRSHLSTSRLTEEEIEKQEPGYHLELREREEKIRRALGEVYEGLSEGHKEVYTMMMEGVPRLKIIEQLGRKKGTIDTQMRTIRIRITEHLEKHDIPFATKTL